MWEGSEGKSLNVLFFIKYVYVEKFWPDRYSNFFSGMCPWTGRNSKKGDLGTMQRRSQPVWEQKQKQVTTGDGRGREGLVSVEYCCSVSDWAYQDAGPALACSGRWHLHAHPAAQRGSVRVHVRIPEEAARQWARLSRAEQLSLLGFQKLLSVGYWLPNAHSSNS